MLPSHDAAAYAKGTLADVPIAIALVHARNRKLSGVLDLRAPRGRHGWVVFWRGQVVSVATTPPVARFGTVLYELGMIDAATLDASTVRSARERRPQADILLEQGAITPGQRDVVVAEQLRRRVHHLFTFPGATTFAFRESRASGVEPAIAVDVLAPLWRGLSDTPPDGRIRDVLAGLEGVALVTISEAVLERAELGPAEIEACEALARAPRTIAELRATARLPKARVDALVYLLLIARCVEPESGPVVRRSGSRPAVSSPVSRVSELASAAQGPGLLGVEAVRRRAARIACETPFETLGVPEGASVEAARAAYMRLVRLWNPERLPPELQEVRGEVERILAHMTAAHHVLTDPVARTATPSDALRASSG